MWKVVAHKEMGDLRKELQAPWHPSVSSSRPRLGYKPPFNTRSFLCGRDVNREIYVCVSQIKYCPLRKNAPLKENMMVNTDGNYSPEQGRYRALSFVCSPHLGPYVILSMESHLPVKLHISQNHCIAKTCLINRDISMAMKHTEIITLLTWGTSVEYHYGPQQSRS